MAKSQGSKDNKDHYFQRGGDAGVVKDFPRPRRTIGWKRGSRFNDTEQSRIAF